MNNPVRLVMCAFVASAIVAWGIGVVTLLVSTAHADVLLPLQYGNALLSVASSSCGNDLDFSQICNSQYITTLTPGVP